MEYAAYPEQSLRDVFRRVARRRWLLTAVAVTVFAIVAAWTFLATKQYRSAALLRIESKTSPASSLIPDQLSSLPGVGLAGLGKDELETEVGVLRSQRMVDHTIDALALNVVVTDPAESRASVIAAQVVDSADVSGKITLTRQSDGRYGVEASKLEGSAPLPKSLAPGAMMLVGSVAITLNETLRTKGPDQIKLRLYPRYKVRERLDKKLTIRRQEGGSRLVEVAFENPDRVLAAQVVDHLVNEYVTYSNTMEEGDAGKTVADLHGAIAQNVVRLSAAEETLKAFQQRARVVVPEEQATAEIKRLAVINGHLDAVRMERSALARLLPLIEQRSKGGADPSAYRQLATFPSLITNRAIQDLLLSLIELENKRSELAVRRTTESEDYKQLVARITELDTQLYSVGRQYLESLDQQIETTASAANGLTDAIALLPGTAMQFTRLVRAQKLQNEEFVLLQKQLKTAELQELLRKEKVRVVDAPRPASPDDPSFPKPAVQLLLGAVLGLVIALAVGLGAELWDGPAPLPDDANAMAARA